MKYVSHITVCCDTPQVWSVKGHRHHHAHPTLTHICGSLRKDNKLTLVNENLVIEITVLSSGLLHLRMLGEQCVLYEGRLVQFGQHTVAWMPKGQKKCTLALADKGFFLLLCLHGMQISLAS